MHLDDERIQRLIDGELDAGSEAEARRHCAECTPCSRLVAQATGEAAAVRELLTRLDPPASGSRPPLLVAGGAAHPIGFKPVQLAAALLLVFGLAGIALALPGSPVRDWIDRITERPPVAVPESTETPVEVPPAAVAVSGISVLPGRVMILDLKGAGDGAEAVLTLSDDPELIVRAASGAATFASAPGRITITLREPAARIDIRIPGSAPRVEVRCADRRLFLKEGATPPQAIRPADGGVWRLPLSTD